MNVSREAPIKVVHIISGGDLGGAKTHIETLLPKLNASNKVRAHLLCIMEGALTEECRRLGVPVKVIPQRQRYELTVIKKMADWISGEGFEIIHCHGARANFIAFFLRFFLRLPTLTTLHSDYRLDFKGSGYRHWLYTPLNVISLKRFKYFIAVSQGLKNLLVEKGFEKAGIEVIHNGIDFGESPPIKPRGELVREYGLKLDENAVIIGCVARLHPVKGVDILLEAAKLLFRDDINAVVLIAGEGGERNSLESYIKAESLGERVKLLGFIEDIYSFYGLIDINVLPSRSEGIPLALIEGARRRLSTIASDTGGIPEVIRDKETGLLFPVGDSKALSEMLYGEVKSPDEGRRRGARLYEDASRRFSAGNMAESHIAFYERILRETIGKGRK